VLEPGDAVFFHCNALHRSDQNRSPNRRYTLLICYNAVSNDATVREDDRYYVPLERVDDGAIKRAGLKFAGGGNKEHFATQAYVPDVGRGASSQA
jgi:ectoine hydroxylase-related dioxygenase (phytanoyl-CoA dioxygenase family)